MESWQFDLLKKYLTRKLSLEIPTDFHNRVEKINEILSNDFTGMVRPIYDFMVRSASSSKFSFDGDSPGFLEFLEKWAKNLNIELVSSGVEKGLIGLAKQYYMERWESSFIIMGIRWKDFGEIVLPEKVWFYDPTGIEVKGDEAKLGQFKFILKSGKNFITLPKANESLLVQKPFSHWYDKYPVPYFVARGTLYNALFKKLLKDKQVDVLEGIIPYLMHIKMGTERLALEKGIAYTDEQALQLKNKIREIVSEQESDPSKKGKIYVSPFDKTIEHVIPDLAKIINEELFREVDRDILASLGMVEFLQRGTRREAIINPKPLIAEIVMAVKDFVEFMDTLIELIKKQNKEYGHPKYASATIRVIATPVKLLLTTDDKILIKNWYDRGLISKHSAVDFTTELDSETEFKRRTKEIADGLEADLYPPLIMNQEDRGIDIPVFIEEQEEVPENKKAEPQPKPQEAKSDIISAPYNSVKDLPARIRNKLSPELQEIFIKVFNNAYETYGTDVSAFRVAWSIIKKLGRKNNKGIWVLKKQAKKLANTIQKGSIEEFYNQLYQEMIERKKLELLEKKSQLLDKLLGEGNETSQ